jgi:hypothetical protein
LSKFGDPKACINGCGAMIYFDPNSPTGHPTADKWVPLEIKEGRKTDQPHNCPKKKTNASSAAKPDSLKFAESLFDVLRDYIRLKTKELEAGRCPIDKDDIFGSP